MVTSIWADGLPSGTVSPASAFLGYFLMPVVAVGLFLCNRRLRRARQEKRKG